MKEVSRQIFEESRLETACDNADNEDDEEATEFIDEAYGKLFENKRFEQTLLGWMRGKIMDEKLRDRGKEFKKRGSKRRTQRNNADDEVAVALGKLGGEDQAGCERRSGRAEIDEVRDERGRQEQHQSPESAVSTANPDEQQIEDALDNLEIAFARLMS